MPVVHGRSAVEPDGVVGAGQEELLLGWGRSGPSRASATRRPRWGSRRRCRPARRRAAPGRRRPAWPAVPTPGPRPAAAAPPAARCLAPAVVGQLTGRGQLRHHRGVHLWPGLVGLVGGGEVEDHPHRLARGHPPGAERAPVSHPVDLEPDRLGVIAGTNEVGVQRVDAVAGVDAEGRRAQRLGHDLVQATPRVARAGAHPHVGALRLCSDRFEGHHRREVHGGRVSAPACRGRQPLPSPSGQ